MVKDITVNDKDDSKKNKIIFSSSEICNHISTKFVVINGGPGSGKTTLMRNIFLNILKNSVNGSETSYEGIGRFRVPIYLECRTERQNNLRDFLKESIPNLNSPNEVIYDAFKEVKGQVFLIDGYDEVNDDSRKLVREIIPFCSKYNATCIVSGRVDAGNNFISNLENRKLSYNEMLIEPISEISAKLSFLKRYSDNMVDVDSEELVKSFEKLNDSAQQVFFCPILLVLFISLFLNHRNSLPRLNNEQSAYKAIKEIFSKEIAEKLKESNVKNHELKTKYLLEVFSDHSLRLFRNKIYFFGKDELLRLTEDCKRRMPNDDVDIKGIFSCILTPENSLKSEKDLTYAFTHSSIQEYLAVEQIIKIMRECEFDWNSWHPERSLRKQFLHCLGVSTSHLNVIRYGNIIKLLILETFANGAQKKYIRTFNAILEEYFRSSQGFLFDLVSSSNYDSAIISIVNYVLRARTRYLIRYTRHIRPLTALLKEMDTKVIINFKFSEFLTVTDCANFVQLESVLKDDSEIVLDFKHSYDNYRPLNGEFYSQLKNIKCRVTEFRACVSSSEHISIVMGVWRDKRYSLNISTVSASDVSFSTLDGYEGYLGLRVKYTEDCPSTGSNPVTGRTILSIADIPADGRDNVYKIIKYLSPESKEFISIELANCHLTVSDANMLLKKLEEEKIKTEMGEGTEVKREKNWSWDEDKSINLELCLPDFEKREAEQREAEQREAEQQEAEKRESEKREEAQREVEQREAVYLRRIAIMGGIICPILGVIFWKIFRRL